MAKEMQEACDGINEASKDAVDAVAALGKDEKSMDAKNRLLEAGKAILKHMVRLLQLNDLYEVTVVLKQIQAVRQMLQTRDDPKFAVSEFTLMSNFLSKLLTSRTKRCHDGAVRAQLDESGLEIARASIPMMEVQQEFLDNPKATMLKDRREMYVVTLTFGLKKAHDAVRASAKSPFDLSMLDRNGDMDFDEDFVALSNANWEGGLDALQSAIKNGDEAEMESALRALKKDILSQLDAAEEAARGIEDPNLRDRMLDALARLRKQLENMMDKLASDARQALKNRDPEAIRAALDELRLLRARILDGLAKDNLLQHVVNIDSLMRSLVDAAKAGDAKESNAIVNDIGNEVNDIDDLISTLAANVTDDASRRKRLEDGLANLKKHLAALGQLTTQTLADPTNNDLWKRLQDLMDRIRGVTNDLVNASLQTTPQELLGLGANLDEALKRLLDAAKNAQQNPDAVSVQAANVIAKLKPALDLATCFAEFADPHTAAAITKGVEGAKKEAAQMVAASKDVVAATKSKDKKGYDDAFGRLRDAIDRLRKCNGQILDAAIADSEAEMKSLSEQMESAKNRIAAALKKGDVKGAIAALSDFQEAGRKKVLLARILAEETDDEELRRQLLAIAAQLEDELGMDLLASIKASLKDPKSEAAYQAALAKLNKALASSARINELAVSASPEEKYAANGKVMVRTAELVKLGVNDGNFGEAAAMLKNLREQLAKHRQLANQIGEACAHDPSVAERLNAQMDKLEEVYKQIVVATKAATTDPSKKAVVAALVTEFQKVAAQSAEEAKKAKASAAAEKKRQEEEAIAAAKRRKLEEEELAGKNDIYRAAHKVELAVDAADDMPKDGSPASMLVFTAAKIAKAMKKLSELSESTDKAGTINQAREIATLTADIVKYANLAGAECSDPKLARELKDAAGVAKNFSIQLKIVCAVKASSGDDATAQKSLVTCAQGLCKNVVECVDVSRVARLKKKLR
jgi:hypothetical protein